MENRFASDEAPSSVPSTIRSNSIDETESSSIVNAPSTSSGLGTSTYKSGNSGQGVEISPLEEPPEHVAVIVATSPKKEPPNPSDAQLDIVDLPPEENQQGLDVRPGAVNVAGPGAGEISSSSPPQPLQMAPTSSDINREVLVSATRVRDEGSVEVVVATKAPTRSLNCDNPLVRFGACGVAVLFIGLIVAVSVALTRNDNSQPSQSPTLAPFDAPSAPPIEAPASTSAPTNPPSAAMPPKTPKPAPTDAPIFTRVPTDAPVSTPAPTDAPSPNPTPQPVPQPTLKPTTPSQFLRNSICATSPKTCGRLTDVISPQSRAFAWLENDPNLTTYTEKEKLQRFALATLYFSTQGDGWVNTNSWLDLAVGECDWEGIWCSDSKSINSISLSSNGLSGTIPTELEFFKDSLWQLYLSSNEKLIGSIPTELGNLKDLQNLYLDGFALSGPFPSELGQLSKLRQIACQGKILPTGENKLSGPIPSEFGMLSNLEHLWIHDTSISGTIPTELGQMKNLEKFSAFRTYLSGTIPSEMGQLDSLQSLGVSFTSLSGFVPSEICSLRDNQGGALEILDVDCSGTPPKVTCTCCTNCSFGEV